MNVTRRSLYDTFSVSNHKPLRFAGNQTVHIEAKKHFPLRKGNGYSVERTPCRFGTQYGYMDGYTPKPNLFRPPPKRKPQGKIEKYIMRKAFDTPEDPYLPQHILYRQKEQFSDGVGYSWIDELREKAELEVMAMMVVRIAIEHRT